MSAGRNLTFFFKKLEDQNITVPNHHSIYLQTLLWSQMGLCSSQ